MGFMPLAQLYDVNSQTEVVGNVPLYFTIAIPLLLGAIIFWYGLRAERSGGSSKLKWLGLVPLAVGAIWGYRYFAFVSDPAYRAMGMLRRQIWLHYGAFFASVVGIVALILWAIIEKRLHEREE